jgi:uncharacterized RDD family membrane protein YckC
MKCPKCGYLGFETTDRCRNCQYDFSLTPFSSDPELTLHGTEHERESLTDFELAPIAHEGDALSATALDLDRLFGDSEPAKIGPAPAEPPAKVRGAEPLPAQPTRSKKREHVAVRQPAEDRSAPLPSMVMAKDSAKSIDEAALPFDDAPLMPPPAARTPLAVRRSTPEVPRNRPRTTRPVRTDSLDFEPAAKANHGSIAATETEGSLAQMPSLAVRVGAGLIDLALLAGINAAVLYLTLRVSGLHNTLADLRVLPPVPLVGFLAVVAFGYVAAFTVAGGQTIGKMALSLRVTSDDGRPVDAATGTLRALGCMLVPVTLGLSYLPALFTTDHRALHDRLAGTRVVQE